MERDDDDGLLLLMFEADWRRKAGGLPGRPLEWKLSKACELLKLVIFVGSVGRKERRKEKARV